MSLKSSSRASSVQIFDSYKTAACQEQEESNMEICSCDSVSECNPTDQLWLH